MNTFSKYDMLYGLESHLSRNMLEEYIKKFRVSGDFTVAKNATLKPGKITSVNVRLEKSLFPDLKFISPGMLKHLEISMRSCFAQSGIHIIGKIFDYIHPQQIEKLNKKGSVDISVQVVNRGLSDVKVKAGGDFFRLYFRPAGNAITGKKLLDIIKEGKLKVEGKYGETRSLVGANIPDFRGEITGNMIDEAYDAKELKESEADQALTLKLKLNGNVYIPDNKKKILIESKKNLVDILQPFDSNNPKHTEHNFNIGETFYVDFGDYFGTIIYQGYDGGGHHIISPLIDPGFKGPIRTEIVKGHNFNDFIELHIYHKNG